MSNREVFESRDQVNATLIKNLVDYGNVEPPGLYGRAYNDGTQTKYQFSAANYLRIAAAQRENNWQDLRWVSEQAVEDRNLTLKSGAKPVEIEYWQGIDDGQSYEGNLRKFYNAADIVEMEGQGRAVRGNEEADIEYAQDILLANGFSDDTVNSHDKIFSAIHEYATINGADEFATPLTAQLFLKTSHLSYDYAQKPLYTEEQMEKIADNPKIIFHAMKKAQELVNAMQLEHDRELKNMAAQMKEERNQPFKDLTIDFFWSERYIKNLQGKEYQDGQQLRGEAAYEFLVQLNAADKEQFDNKLQGFGNYDKTKLSICYGKYDHGEMRVDLGDLELCNKTSIADALLVRFNEYRNYLMTDEQAINTHIGFQKSNGKEVTREQVIAECEQENAQCERAMQRFAAEEKRHLENHPELQLINERKADVFLYYCTENDFSKVPNNMMLAVHSASEYEGLMLGHCDYRQSVPSTARQWNQPEPSGIVFESAVANDAIKSAVPVQIALTQDAQVSMGNLEKLSIRIENYGTIMEPLERPTIEELKGAQAVQRFIQEKKYEVDVAQRMNYQEKIIRQPQQQMTFSYRGEEFYKLKYEIGSGTFNKSIPAGLPIFNEENNKMNKELQQAVYTYMKYRGAYRENGMYELNRRHEIKLPEPEVVRAKIMEGKPSVHSSYNKQFGYYAALAMSDFKVDTSEKFLKVMVQEMKQDGFTDTRVANVIKTNICLGLRFSDEKSNKNIPKVKKRKLQVVSDKKAGLGYEMNRTDR